MTLAGAEVQIVVATPASNAGADVSSLAILERLGPDAIIEVTHDAASCLTVVGVFPALFAFIVLKWLGIAAIFHAIGRRLGRVAGFSPSTLGAVLLVFAAYVVVSLVPSAFGVAGLLAILGLKLVFFLLVEIPAVGLVILTRMGGRRSGGTAATVPAPPPAPAADPAG